MSIELPGGGHGSYNPPAFFHFATQRGARMRLFAEIREVVALSLLVLLAAAPWAKADEDCPDEVAPPTVTESTSESHRRGVEKKKAAQARLATEVSETPIERLQQLCSGDVVLQPIIVRSTLAEAMRRVALWGDCCPICGHSASGKEPLAVPAGEPSNGLTQKRLLDVEQPDAEREKGVTPEPLRAGEPAQVILDTQKRLGKSVTDGTEFGGSPELLIKWIRILDEENRRQQLALEETLRCETPDEANEEEALDLRSQIETLRQACRQLQETADLLEEQNLFESADSIRGFADALRRQSRHKLQALDATGDEPPTRLPRHASSTR
ncbi:MAG: hypothetical protein ACREHD_02460 [Pirellulales bacterium]